MSPYSRPITCEVCHTNYGTGKFTASSASHHPVQVISGSSMATDNWTTTLIRCKDCHNANSVALTPNLSPDLAPSNYTNVSGNIATDGYPNHDVTSPDNQVNPGDPPHLLAMRLSGGQRTVAGSGTYTKLPSSNPATDYAFCFSCHDGSGNTSRGALDNILDAYVKKGHYFKSAAPTGGNVNDRIPCSDCLQPQQRDERSSVRAGQHDVDGHASDGSDDGERGVADGGRDPRDLHLLPRELGCGGIISAGRKHTDIEAMGVIDGKLRPAVLVSQRNVALHGSVLIPLNDHQGVWQRQIRLRQYAMTGFIHKRCDGRAGICDGGSARQAGGDQNTESKEELFHFIEPDRNSFVSLILSFPTFRFPPNNPAIDRSSVLRAGNSPPAPAILLHRIGDRLVRRYPSRQAQRRSVYRWLRNNISAPNTLYAGSTASEMAHLFYVTLGNSGHYNTSGLQNPCALVSPIFCLTNAGPFFNIQNDYWTGTQFPDILVDKWAFFFDFGYQPHLSSASEISAWAVHDGDPLATPIPAAVWLFGGALGALGWVRRRQAKA